MANAPVTTIQPADKDTYLWQHNPTVNYGNQLLMYVGGAPYWREHTLVKFDLSSIPDGSVINSAYLRLYYNAAGSTGDPGGRTYTVYRMTQDWVELECTWNIFSTGNSWTTAGGDYTDTNKASLTLPSMGGQDSWVSWTVTDIVEDWITFGNPNYGFLIREEEVAGIYSAFRSTQHSESTTRPILEVDYTPVFDFSVSAEGGLTVTQGGSGTIPITVTLVSGSPKLVSLSVSGLPSGASAFFNPLSDNPTFTSTLTITTSSSTPLGSYLITVSGTGSQTHTTTFMLMVNPASGPVGGVVTPVNKLEILTPYIALVGLIAVVSTVYVIKRRKD
ncbi:MAG: DNRLRE domain-containing protein [Candidatus Bathyarchaeia archaeon]